MVRALRWGLIGAGVLLIAASAFETRGTVAFCLATTCISVATILIILAGIVLITGIITHFLRRANRDTMTITIAEGDEKDAEQLGKISESVSQGKNAERRFAHHAEAESAAFIELPKDTVKIRGMAKQEPTLAKPVAKTSATKTKSNAPSRKPASKRR